MMCDGFLTTSLCLTTDNDLGKKALERPFNFDHGHNFTHCADLHYVIAKSVWYGVLVTTPELCTWTCTYVVPVNQIVDDQHF